MSQPSLQTFMPLTCTRYIRAVIFYTIMSPHERILIFLANICFFSWMKLSTVAAVDCHTGPFICPAEKQVDFPLPFPDLNDCNYYHICYSLEEATRDSCGPAGHFNGESCVEGLCPTAIPMCKPQEPPSSGGMVRYEHHEKTQEGYAAEISGQSEQNGQREQNGQWKQNGQNMEATITAEKAAATANEQPQNSQGASGASGDCTAEGICNRVGRFAKPGNCRHYFKCIHAHGAFRNYPFDCGKGRHFDEPSDKCLIGPCPTATNCPD